MLFNLNHNFQAFPNIKNSSVEKSLLFCLGISFLVGLYFRFEVFDLIQINDWITRDFDRAFSLVEGDYFPLAGPDMNNGGRLPGPFLYILLSLPLLFWKTYESIFNFNFILNISSIIALFFVLKRFFGKGLSSISTVVFLMAPGHVGVVAWPINPAFLFPFLVLFFWLFFEFFLNGKFWLLPWIAVTLALSMQIHFSIFVFCPVVLVLIVGFRLKIPGKFYFWAITGALICFSPFIAFKFLTISLSKGERTLFGPELSSIGEIFKIFILHNSIFRISFDTGIEWSLAPTKLNLEHFYYAPAALFNYVMTTMGFWVLIIKVCLGIKRGTEKNKKEWAVLSSFLIPAILYEIINPFPGHIWYTFVFLIPQSLLIAMVFNLLLSFSPSGSCRHVFLLTYFAIVSYLGFNISEESKKMDHKITKNLMYGGYENNKLLYRTLMDGLNLSPKEFADKVFMEGYTRDRNKLPSSVKFLQLISKEFPKKSIRREDGDGNCFYVVDRTAVGSNQVLSAKFLKFFNDFEIESEFFKSFSFLDKGFLKKLQVYKYTPKYNQDCYKNYFNQFVVDPEIRDLLFDGRHLNVYSDADLLQQSYREKFDSESNLEEISANYILYSKFLGSPLRLKFDLKRKNGLYYIRGTTKSVYFWGNNARLNYILARITFKNFDRNFLKGKSVGHYLLSRNSMAHYLESYNNSWYREVPLSEEIKLKRNEFNILVEWGSKKRYINKKYEWSFMTQKNQFRIY